MKSGLVTRGICLEAMMEIFEDDAAADCADNIAPTAGHNQGFLARYSVALGSGEQNGREDSGED